MRSYRYQEQKGRWERAGRGGGGGRGGSRKNERVKAREKDLRGRCYIVGEVTFQQLVVPLRVN